MFGFEPAILAGFGALALAASAAALTALRHWRAHRDRSIDWDDGGDIV
ncbi:MAG: hypothetical protein WEB63_06380 [Cucumibacter sp.]